MAVALMEGLSSEGGGVRHRAEDAALHLDHLDRGEVVAVVGGAAAILEQQAFVAAVIGLAHGGVDADIGGDAGKDDVVDAALVEDQFEIGGKKLPLPGLSMIGSPATG